jgi:hypothetical protein
MNHFTITPRGPFSFSLAMSVLGKLPMTSRHARGSTSTAVRLPSAQAAVLLDRLIAQHGVTTTIDGQSARSRRRTASIA